MEKPDVHILPRICPKDGVTKLIKKVSAGIATVYCPHCGYYKNRTGEEWSEDTDLYPQIPPGETPSEEKHCPLCDWKLLIHVESPRRQLLFCSNPDCGYKSEFY